jgi:hypothetical protein
MDKALSGRELTERVEQDKFVITGFACRPSKIRPIKAWCIEHDRTFSSVVREALFEWWEVNKPSEDRGPI